MDARTRLLVVSSKYHAAVEAATLARQHGVQVLTTEQPLGASWLPLHGSSGLEPHVLDAVKCWIGTNPKGLTLGFELRGPNPFGATNIDHSHYHFSGGEFDDRSCTDCSLIQLASLLGIAVQPHLRPFGTSQLSSLYGELPSSGSTSPLERFARSAAAEVEWRDRKVLIRITRHAGAATGELLFGEADEQLHVNEITERWVYFGPRHRILFGKGFPETYWCGGSAIEGYFCILSPGRVTQQSIINLFWR